MGWDLNIYRENGDYVDVWLHKGYCDIALQLIFYDKKILCGLDVDSIINDLSKNLQLKMKEMGDSRILSVKRFKEILDEISREPLYKTINKFDRNDIKWRKFDLRFTINELKKVYEVIKNDKFVCLYYSW